MEQTRQRRPRRVVSPERVVLSEQPITAISCAFRAHVRSREALVRKQLDHSGERSHETSLGVYFMMLSELWRADIE